MDNTVFALLLLGWLVAVDGRTFIRSGGRLKAVYGLLALFAAYLTFLYVTDLPWPNLDDLLKAVYGGPARAVVSLLNPSASL